MRWLSREEWQEPFNELIERHLGPACERAGLAPDALADTIGGQHGSVLWGCIFEDFLASDLLDQAVPMLGNVSPRKAAKTKKGCEKLVGWLRLIENSTARQEARSPMAAYDLSWM